MKQAWSGSKTARRLPLPVVGGLLALCLLAGLTPAQRPGRSRKPPSGLPPVYDVPQGQADLSGRVTFARIRFDMGAYISSNFIGAPLGDGGPLWSHDYPIAGRHLMRIMSELSKTDVTLDQNEPVFRLGDPELFKYPLAYICEVGYMELSDEEIKGMREYCLRGGFLLVDDFRGPNELYRLQEYVKRAFPERELKRLDVSHPIFNCFFSIKTLDLPAMYGGGRFGGGNLKPEFWGLEDETGRLQMVVNYNYDVSDFWQWSDNAFMPIEETNEAYKFGVNYFMYALTH